VPDCVKLKSDAITALIACRFRESLPKVFQANGSPG
jgi:hypothetical protein